MVAPRSVATDVLDRGVIEEHERIGQQPPVASPRVLFGTHQRDGPLRRQRYHLAQGEPEGVRRHVLGVAGQAVIECGMQLGRRGGALATELFACEAVADPAWWEPALHLVPPELGMAPRDRVAPDVHEQFDGSVR